MCQYIDLVAGDSYVNVNKKMIRLVGLSAATYWAEILNIAVQVRKKNKVDSEGYWKIDRKYMEQQTSLTAEEQLTCDSLLTSLGVLEAHPADPNKLGIKLAEYVQIVVDDNIKQIDLVKKTVKVTKEQKAKNKKDGVIITMKRLLSETDSTLRSMYESWVESVYNSGKGFLTKDKIRIFEQGIRNFSTDPEVTKKLLQEAIITGYTNPDWIINNYTKSTNKVGHLSTQRISEGVNTDIHF